jgi:hypothetical protein
LRCRKDSSHCDGKSVSSSITEENAFASGSAFKQSIAARTARRNPHPTPCSVPSRSLAGGWAQSGARPGPAGGGGIERSPLRLEECRLGWRVPGVPLRNNSANLKPAAQPRRSPRRSRRGERPARRAGDAGAEKSWESRERRGGCRRPPPGRGRASRPSAGGPVAAATIHRPANRIRSWLYRRVTVTVAGPGGPVAPGTPRASPCRGPGVVWTAGGRVIRFGQVKR